MSQMVQVVSMLDVPSLFGSVSFQSKDVRGAQNSLFLFCVNSHLVGNDVWLCNAYKHCETIIHMSTSPPWLSGHLFIIPVLVKTNLHAKQVDEQDVHSNMTAETTQHAYTDIGSCKPK